MSYPKIGKTLTDITAEVREVNIEKGWRPAGGGPGTNTFGDYIALLHSEVSEALEAYRDHRLADATRPTCGRAANGEEPCPEHGPSKPEGVGSELADVLIRLVDMADVFGIRISGYYMIADVREVSAVMESCVSFGDYLTALHVAISESWQDRARLPMVLRVLVTVTRKFGIDLEEEYERKIRYNRTRSFQHGGRTLAGDKERPLTPATIGRFNALWLAMPVDPRGWWTGPEVDAFVDQWYVLGLPKLVLQDATGERLSLWCEDARRAADMVGMADAYIKDTGFEIARGEYSVGIVQAEEKETNNGNS